MYLMHDILPWGNDTIFLLFYIEILCPQYFHIKFYVVSYY